MSASARFDRHLRLLGVTAGPPAFDALAGLVAAQLTRVPFENVSKLLHRRDPAMRLPPHERWLDGIEHQRLGGTCYANASHFAALLAHLGYDVRLCGADMDEPDVHLVSVVRLEGREWLIDVGFGAPFDAPLPLDLADDVVVERGAERYLLHPRTADGRTRLDFVRDGRLRHGYDLKPPARAIEEFAGVIERSFAANAHIMNLLAITRHEPDRTLALRNRWLKEHRAGESAMREIPAAALPAQVEALFGVPAGLVRAAIEGLDLDRNPWG